MGKGTSKEDGDIFLSTDQDSGAVFNMGDKGKRIIFTSISFQKIMSSDISQ